MRYGYARWPGSEREGRNIVPQVAWLEGVRGWRSRQRSVEWRPQARLPGRAPALPEALTEKCLCERVALGQPLRPLARGIGERRDGATRRWNGPGRG